MKKHKRKSPILIIVLLLLLAGMGFLGYHLFNITVIEVTGNNSKAADYIINLSGIEKGTNIFKIDDAVLKENIEKDPYIKFIEAQRVYPDKIILKVKERTPAALVMNENSSLLLDNEGYILKINKEINAQDYPAVNGLDVSNFTVGKQIGFADAAQYIAMNTIINEIYANSVNTIIAGIDLFNINDIKMTTKNGINIKFGNYDLPDKKILWIKNVLDYFEKQGISTGTIDVSSGEFASYSAG